MLHTTFLYRELSQVFGTLANQTFVNQVLRPPKYLQQAPTDGENSKPGRLMTQTELFKATGTVKRENKLIEAESNRQSALLPNKSLACPLNDGGDKSNMNLLSCKYTNREVDSGYARGSEEASNREPRSFVENVLNTFFENDDMEQALFKEQEEEGDIVKEENLYLQRKIDCQNSQKNTKLLLLEEESLSDDIVLDGLVTTNGNSAVVSEDNESFNAIKDASSSLSSLLSKPSKSKVNISPAIVDLVTEEYAELRKREIKRRRQILYELTHPNPLHYTFAGKLVPMPPLAFGEITPEAVALGEQLMCSQRYRNVRSSTSTDFFFEINNLYLEIVMLGRANAGKSSLINALLAQDLAKTSSLPNSTRTINFYQAATPEEIVRFVGRDPTRLAKLPGNGLQFTFVDVPGFGIQGMSEKWRDAAITLTDNYLGTRRSVNTVFMCIDATKGLTRVDERYFKWIENIHGLFYIVLTKCDAVSHQSLCRTMRQIYQLMTAKRSGQEKMQHTYPLVIPVSAETGSNIDFLRGLIVETSGIIPGDRLRALLHRKLVERNRRDEQIEKRKTIALMKKDSTSENIMVEKHQQLPVESSVNETAADTARIFEEATSVPLDADLLCEVLKDAPEDRGYFPCNFSTTGAGGTPSQDGIGSVVNAFRYNLGVPPMTTEISLEDKRPKDNSSEKLNEMTPSLINPLNKKTSDLTSAPRSNVLGLESELSTENSETQQGQVSSFIDAVDNFSAEFRAKAPHWKQKQNKELISKITTPVDLKAIKEVKGASRLKSSLILVENPGRASEGLSASFCGKLTKPVVQEVALKGKTRLSIADKSYYRNSLIEDAKSLNPTSPWRMYETIRQQQRRVNKEPGIKMTASEVKNYRKTTGKIIEDFFVFESERNMKRMATDSRIVHSPTARAKMELGDASRIAFAHQPAGLFRAYGKMKSLVKLSNVKGTDTL